MCKTLEWNHIVEEINGKKVRKNNIFLTIDCVYKNKAYASNKKNEVLPYLMDVENSRGFRIKNSYDKKQISYVVLLTTKKDIYWQDTIDEELGLCVYYGDNKETGSDLHSKRGNKLLKDVYNYAQSNDINVRKKIPPFFLFENDPIGGVKFKGLLVPGYKNVSQKEWLTAIWSKKDEGGRFLNYKAIFTILDTFEGSENSQGSASIDLKWLEDLLNKKGFESPYAPLAWKEFISKNKYKPLLCNVRARSRKKEEQLPSEPNKEKMLKYIIEYYKNNSIGFECLAIDLVKKSDNNILEDPMHTKATRDGGRDGIGEYRILNNLTNPLKVEFAIEAKCYNPYLKNPDKVTIKETSRLISRIRNKQFGVLVTTSYVNEYAYKELIEDSQPILIIAGKDIIEILYQNEITNLETLKHYLDSID